MNSPNRAALIAKLQKVIKKHYKPVSPPDRTLLEHMLYACCLENATFDKANEAFAQLQQAYFDWNEVRVTSATELAEVFVMLPQPQAAAQRIKRVLQGMFDVLYGFDLEPLKKQNLGKALKDIERFGASPFVAAYVTQNGLGGHAIATDEATYDVLVVVGIVSEAEAAKGLLPGIERAIPKTKGVEFFSELHQFAADFFNSPTAQRIRGMFAELAPDAKERIADRLSRKQVMAHDQALAAAKQRKADREAAAAALETPHKPPKPPGSDGVKDRKDKEKPRADAKGKSAVKGPVPKAPTVNKPAKVDATDSKKRSEPSRPPAAKKKAEESSKKTVSKGLSKKKPR
jgi:endonuclease-3